MNHIDIFNFYFEKSWNQFKNLPLKTQLLLINKNKIKVGVMDFCGMFYACNLPSSCDIFIMENVNERIEIEKYSIIIVIVFVGQNVYLDFECIKISFSKGILVA